MTVLVLLLLVNPFADAGTIVFSTDFTNSTGSGTFSGAGTVTQSSPGNNFLQNTSAGSPGTATQLILNNLPGHASIELSFTFWAIDSWDGLTNTCCGNDYFRMRLNGQGVYSASFRNWGISPARLESESTLAATLVFGNDSNLTGNAGYSDSIWSILLNLPHQGSSATIEFFPFGTDGGSDESFGLDNVTVQVTGTPTPANVPEPSSLILSGIVVTTMLLAWRLRVR